MIEQLKEKTPWEEVSHAIWPISTFTIRRNLEKNLFPGKLSTEKKIAIGEELHRKFFGLAVTDCESVTPLDDLSPLEREFFLEHFFLGDGLPQVEEGQGVMVGKRARMMAQYNLGDHLTLHLLDASSDWSSAWKTISEMESGLMKEINFAHSSKFGYLTADARHCGTGLEVKAYLHLPALSLMGQLKTALLEDVDKEVSTVSIDKEEGTFLGDLVVLKNTYAIGLSDEQMLRHLFGSANRLMNGEKTLRAHLRESPKTEVRDQVSRAYGLLTHSVKLETHEALSALSLLKLGIDLGWVKGMTDQEVNDLYFRCRRGHLLIDEEKSLETEEVVKKRAELINKKLSTLSIEV